MVPSRRGPLSAGQCFSVKSSPGKEWLSSMKNDSDLIIPKSFQSLYHLPDGFDVHHPELSLELQQYRHRAA
jgi:hypothetical protein